MVFKHKHSDDHTLRVILYYLQPLIAEIRQSDGVKLNNRAWIEDLYEKMIWHLQGFNTDVFNFDFERMGKSSYRVDVFKKSLLKVKKTLQTKGTNISIEELKKVEDWKFYEKSPSIQIVVVKKTIDTIDELLLMLPDK